MKEADGIGLSSYKNITSQIKQSLKENKTVYDKLISTHHAEVKRREKRFKSIIQDDLIDIIIHGTHLTEDDLKQLGKKGISLVLCPRSNGYFGVGFPPICEIVNLKIPISLGTDNIMNVQPDLFEELRYLFLIFRVLNEQENRAKLSAQDLLKMVTINAAQNFKVQDQVGSIEEGKYADYFLVDLNEANYYCSILNKELLYPLIVQRTKPNNIKKVFINGEKVYERK
jgi:cytosine/adenosine deaminase-related metal-dependent hydrolase